MNAPRNPYYASVAASRAVAHHQAALMRAVDRLSAMMPVIGLRNPKIGRADLTWDYCNGPDWVMSFHSGQLWLAHQLTGDPAFRDNAQARRPGFRAVLQNRKARDHDLGFQFSLSAVADWRMTGATEARELGLRSAEALVARFNEAGHYIQAWNPSGPHNRERAAFVQGRAIVDTMQNLALLHWAFRETAVEDFREVARLHAETTRRHLVRPDGTSFHTFVFDPADGRPLRGETHQGFAHGSCWSRGQAWLIHGYAQTYLATRDPADLDTARLLASTAERLMGADRVPVWDYALPAGETRWRDSSAGAIMAAGLYILAGATEGTEADRWRAFADRLLDGLIEECDLTGNPAAQGLLAEGAAHVSAGRSNTMLPYGDYYYMEALMRSLGHASFFW